MTYLEAEIRKMQFRDMPHFVENATLRKLLRLPKVKLPPVLIADLNLKVEKGDVISLVGPSGVGKSTLLRILAGLETQFDGKIALGGKVIDRPSRRIQVVFQDNCLLPWLDVEGNIAFAIKDNGHTHARETKDWIEKVGLTKEAKALPKTLSGGEASRVAFARAFIAPPELLLLDEPFRALDTITKEVLQQELMRFANETNTTVVLVSHSIDDAVFLSDRVIVLAGHPLHILKEFPIPLERPRDRKNNAILDLADQIKTVLRAAVESGPTFP